jgi:hypothetical protein
MTNLGIGGKLRKSKENPPSFPLLFMLYLSLKMRIKHVIT